MNKSGSGMQVIGDRILLDVTLEKKTSGGLIIPEIAKNDAESGIIMDVGPQVESPLLRYGVKVIFGRYAGTMFKFDYREYKVVREEDIMLILPPPIEHEEICNVKLLNA